MDDSPQSQKRKLEEDIEKTDKSTTVTAAPPPPKKVILNRNISIEPIKAAIDNKEKEKTEEKSETKSVEDKKIIKLSQLSAKEV